MKTKVFGLIVILIFFSQKTKATDWYLNSNTSLNSSLLSSWTSNSNGSAGSVPLSFTSAGDIWHFQNRPNNTILLSSSITFVATSTVYIGDGISNLKIRFNGIGQFSGSPVIIAQNHSTIYINGQFDSFDDQTTVFNAGSAVFISSNYSYIGEIRDYLNPYYDLYITKTNVTSNNATRFNVSHNLYIGDGTYDTGNQEYPGDATQLTNFRVMGDIYVKGNNCSLSTFTTTNVFVGDGIINIDGGYNGLNLNIGVLSPTTGVPATRTNISGLLSDKSFTNVFLPSNSTFSNVIAGSMSLTGQSYNISTSTVTSLLNDISQSSSTYSNITINDLNIAGTGTYTASNNLIVGGGFTLSATNGFSLNPTNITPITFSANSCVLNTNLILEASTATISGAISGAGLIIGDNAASLVLNGSSSGSLNLQSPYELQNLTIDGTANVSLGTNLNIINNGNFNLTGGELSLNSKTLSIDASSSASLTGGSISDNGTSTFSIGTNNILGSGLQMSAVNNTLNKLITGGSLQLINALNIKDYIQVDGGTFTTGGFLNLKADNILSARVASMSSGTISGNVTIETYIPGGTTGWSLWGANGLPSLIVNNWENQIPMTCSDCPNTCFSLGGVFFSSIQAWDETSNIASAYITNISKNDPITSGKGYWVYVGTTSSVCANITLSSNGSLNQGNITYPITKSNNNFNLIANPYASPIDFDLFKVQNNSLITASMYGYNADVGLMGTYVSPAGSPNNGVNRIIPAGQAFYVECTSGGNVTFTEAMKTSNNTSANPVLRASSLDTKLKLKFTGFNGKTDETFVSSSPMASIDYDPEYDGKKVYLSPKNFGAPLSNNKITSISTKIGNDDFSVNNVGVISNTLIIPLSAKASVTGQYTISTEDALNYAGCVIIKDKLTNTFTDLSINPYIFSLNDTTTSPRFELILCPLNKTVSVKELSESNNIFISQDENGVFVKTFFEQNTKTVISVYNILGQKMAKDIILNEASAITRLDINNQNQILFIKVSSNNQSVTKKIITH